MGQHKNAPISLIIGSRGLQYTVNLWETLGCESFGSVQFDLGPLLEGQTMAAHHKSAYILLTIGSRGLQIQ